MERKIDELGRLVIPMEFRRALGWTTGTRVKMELKGVRVCDRCIIDIKYGEFQEAY